jgi:2-dehydro-3-deoxygluconokinase
MDIVSIGECMVEFFCEGDLSDATTFTKTFGGDTMNLLVAASRLGARTGYITRVGQDPFAPFLLRSWQKEGIDTSRVKLVEGFNGLYFISTLPGGERAFTYYRKGSAASTLEPSDLDPTYIASAKILHLSGITQALSPSCRATALEAAKVAKASGRIVSYDPNFRPRLWSVEEARRGLAELLPYIDVILPSAPEEVTHLLGASSPKEAIEALWAQGVQMVLVKLGPEGCLVGAGGTMTHVPAYSPESVVDSTGAGDAFDGAFLYGMLQGYSPLQAARLGAITAGLKLRGRGAIASLPTREEVYRIFAPSAEGFKERPLK